MINASNEGICVEFWREKQHNPALPTGKYLTYFKTISLNTIFDDFNIWLLGYRTEFSCLCLPQGHTFISTVWLWSADEYVIF